jgi:hypothetical protein
VDFFDLEGEGRVLTKHIRLGEFCPCNCWNDRLGRFESIPKLRAQNPPKDVFASALLCWLVWFWAYAAPKGKNKRSHPPSHSQSLRVRAPLVHQTLLLRALSYNCWGVAHTLTSFKKSRRCFVPVGCIGGGKVFRPALRLPVSPGFTQRISGPHIGPPSSGYLAMS